MYSPQFSEIAAVTVRRLAWAMGSTMGQAVDVLASAVPAFINSEKVCEKCKDHKCKVCGFHNSGKIPDKALGLLYMPEVFS